MRSDCHGEKPQDCPGRRPHSSSRCRERAPASADAGRRWRARLWERVCLRYSWKRTRASSLTGLNGRSRLAFGSPRRSHRPRPAAAARADATPRQEASRNVVRSPTLSTRPRHRTIGVGCQMSSQQSKSCGERSQVSVLSDNSVFGRPEDARMPSSTDSAIAAGMSLGIAACMRSMTAGVRETMSALIASLSAIPHRLAVSTQCRAGTPVVAVIVAQSRERLSFRSVSASPRTSASFLARDQRLSWNSRRMADSGSNGPSMCAIPSGG